VPRRWRIVLGREADRDFEMIMTWTADRFGARQADNYRKVIDATLQELRRSGPDILGSKAREEIRPGLRTVHVARHGRRGRHVILFRLAGSETIEVLRILHDSMDTVRHIPEDSDEH
jgi:toxin ParE1/3/4